MGRRRFDHLIVELSVAVGRRVERYPLWLFLRERGRDPENLSAEDLERFCDGDLDALVAERRWVLTRRSRRRLTRSLRRFDPAQPTPEEFMQRLSDDRA